MNHELFELNAHHLFPKKLDGKNTIKNGIVFCRGCHAALHPEHYSFFKKIFRFFRDHIIEKILFINKNNSYYRVLEFLTGSSTFRNYQLKSIKIIYEEKKNVFFVSPTGSGKSIIFQIPAIIDFLKSFEPTLVLESLNALQKDQVKNLLNRLIPATYINSDLSKNEIYERIMGLKNKEIFFLYIHPKQLLIFNENEQRLKLKTHKDILNFSYQYIVIDYFINSHCFKINKKINYV